MSENWVDITEHVRNGDIPPGPSQSWHFWCAAYDKKLVLLDDEAAYKAWIQKTTQDLGSQQSLEPEISAIIEGEEKYIGFELRLKSYANMVFSTHDGIAENGFLLSNVTFDIYERRKNGFSVSRTGELISRAPNDGPKQDPIDVEAMLSNPDSLGDELTPIFKAFHFALAVRDEEAIGFLGDHIPDETVQHLLRFKENAEDVLREEFVSLNSYLGPIAHNWIESLNPLEESDILKGLSDTDASALWKAFEKEPHPVVWAERITLKTGTQPTGMN